MLPLPVSGMQPMPDTGIFLLREAVKMSKNRLVYIDNLRLLMIIFVIAQHAAITYCGMGDWYYKETSDIGFNQAAFFLYYLSFFQGYFMGLLFLVAGYFTPVSYDKKNFKKFIIERLIRLGIPALLYMLIINPIIVCCVYSFEGIDYSILSFYMNYIISFAFISGSGPLWFSLALLVFTIAYALVKKLIRFKEQKEKDFPSALKILGLILLIGICTFLVRITQPIGVHILNMRLCYFSQYVILFIVGIACKRNRWFEKLNYKRGILCLITVLILAYISWVILMLSSLAVNDDISVFNGGVSWQSALYSLWESSVAVLMAIGLIPLFREKFNKQNKLLSTMSANTFPVYVFHSLIVVVLSLLFAQVKLIPVVKFIFLLFISVPVCFIFTNFIIMKITVMRRLFKS